jgi:hypothetical protein
MMRKYVMIAAMAAAVIFAAALPYRASAMAISAPSGLATAVAAVDPVENVRWYRHYGYRHYWGYRHHYWGYRHYWHRTYWRHRYWGWRRPAYYGAYYRPCCYAYRPYYWYRPYYYGWGWGWGWNRRWWWW